MKKMLAILGSPRKSGNVASMLEVAINRGKKLGYEIYYINLYEKKIELCRGCMVCKKTGVCKINDDIQEIRKLFIESDLVVLASPTYFANVSAVTKNMFDRLVGVVMDDNNSMIPKPKLLSSQKYLLLTTCNTPWPFDRLAGQSTGTIKAMKEFLNISGMKYAGKVIFAGTRNKKQLPKSIITKIEKKIQ